MKFYYRTNAFIADTKILPPGKYGIEQVGTLRYVIVNMSNGEEVTKPTKITEFQKEDGSYYADLPEVLAEVGRFFL